MPLKGSRGENEPLSRRNIPVCTWICFYFFRVSKKISCHLGRNIVGPFRKSWQFAAESDPRGVLLGRGRAADSRLSVSPPARKLGRESVVLRGNWTREGFDPEKSSLVKELGMIWKGIKVISTRVYMSE